MKKEYKMPKIEILVVHCENTLNLEDSMYDPNGIFNSSTDFEWNN